MNLQIRSKSTLNNDSFIFNVDNSLGNVPIKGEDINFQRYYLNKPTAALWARPMAANDLNDDSLEFAIGETSKILKITNIFELISAYRKYGESYRFKNKKGKNILRKIRILNWENIESNYDGVLIKISALPKKLVEFYQLQYYNEDSLIIFNLESFNTVVRF